MRTNEIAKFYLQNKARIQEAETSLPDNKYSGVSELWDSFLSNRQIDDELEGVFNMLNGRHDSTSGVAIKIEKRDREIYRRLYESVLEDDNIPDCSIFGSPEIMKIKDSFSYISYLQNFSRTRDLVPFCKKRFPGKLHVLEIGAGYGGMAEQLISSGLVASYTVIDLSGNLILSATYLKAIFDQQFKVNVCEGLDFDQCFNFLIPQQIDQLADQKFDLVVNCDSLGEMPADVAHAYVEFIARSLSENGVFYSKNGHRRSLGTTRKLTDYGYDRFALVDMQPTPVPSLIFDHHSHVLYLEKKNMQQDIAEVSGQQFDTVSELYRSGIHGEIDGLVENLRLSRSGAEETQFLTTVQNLYENGQLGFDAQISDPDLLSGLNYLQGIELFLRGDKKRAREKLEGYIKTSKSAVAEAIARFVLMQIDSRYVDEKTYKNGVRTEFLLKTMKLDLDKFLQRKSLFKLRRYNLEQITRPFSKRNLSNSVKLKNVIMNVKEGKGVSVDRLT